MSQFLSHHNGHKGNYGSTIRAGILTSGENHTRTFLPTHLFLVCLVIPRRGEGERRENWGGQQAAGGWMHGYHRYRLNNTLRDS